MYFYCLHKCGYEYEIIFEEKKSIEILKILNLTNIIEEYEEIYNHV